MRDDVCPLTRVLYINLDRDEVRRSLIEAQLAQAGMPATRLPAVDGLNVPSDLAPYFIHNDGQKAPLMTPGEVGCYASHLRIYKEIVSAGTSASLVLEDDAMLDRDLGRVITELLAHLPPGWDMVHLSQRPDRAVRPIASLPCGRTLVVYSRIPYGTAGYLVSASGAQKLLNPAVSRIWPIDWDTRRPWLFGLNAYGVAPPPIRQNKVLQSTIVQNGGRSRLRAGLPRPTRYSWTNNPIRTLSALAFNVRRLGPAWWFRCFAINTLIKLRALLKPLTRLTPTHQRPALGE